MKRVVSIYEITNGFLIEFETGRQIKAADPMSWLTGLGQREEMAFRYAQNPTTAANDVETILAAPRVPQPKEQVKVYEDDDD